MPDHTERVTLTLTSKPGVSDGAALIGGARAQDPIQRVQAGESIEDAARDFDLKPGELRVLCELAEDVQRIPASAEGGVVLHANPEKLLRYAEALEAAVEEIQATASMLRTALSQTQKGEDE